MTVYCLELRSTADWQRDVRYREYTTSAKKAELFRQIPKIRFSDSGHHIIPLVREHSGRRLPRNMMLQDHVVDAIVALNKAQPAKADVSDQIKRQQEAIDEANAIIARIWKALGIETYEQAGGKEISEIVADLKASHARLSERIDDASFRETLRIERDCRLNEVRLKDEFRSRALAAEARLAELSEQAAHGWQPIETAPRDGTKIWACEDDVQYECWWRDSRGEAYWMDRVDSEPEPTHWRPLPALPAVVSGSTEGK